MLYGWIKPGKSENCWKKIGEKGDDDAMCNFLVPKLLLGNTLARKLQLPVSK